MAAVPVLAAGVAAYTPVPAPLALAAIAAVTHGAVRQRAGRAPVAWAATAALAPVLAAIAALVAAVVGTGVVHAIIADSGPLPSPGSGTLIELGLAGGSQVLGAPVAGLLAAWMLAAEAHRRREPVLAFLAMASVVIGLVTSALAANLDAGDWAVGLAAAFLVVEVVALGLRRDPFWARPVAAAGAAAEVAAGAVTAVTVQAAVVYGPAWTSVSPVPGGRDEMVGLSFTLVALAWVAADLRRYRGTPRPPATALLRGGGWETGTLAAAASSVLAVLYATASGPAAAAAFLAVAAVAVAGRRPSAGLLAGLTGPWALLTSWGHPLAGSVVTMMAAALAALAAVDRSEDETAAAGADLALTASSIGAAGLAVVVALPLLSAEVAVALAGVALWLLAVVLDRGRAQLGDLARSALLLPVAAAVVAAPRSTLLATAFVISLVVGDTVRFDRPSLGFRAAVAVQGLVVQVAVGAGLSAAETGLALCVTAVAWTGLGAVVDDRWRPPFALAAAGALGLGVFLAAFDPDTLASALLVAGGVVLAAGIVWGQPLVGHLGGALASLGLAGHLALAGVGAAEPYVVPVALQVGVAGWQARRRRSIPSWAAYGPAVALLGGVALAERMAGGHGWHALVAGMVGVGAVAVGGWRRLLGPLLIGTGLLVAVTVNESLSALAGVPTWAWLALAGAFLVTVGVALERTDTTPTDAGRRLVDVLAERYD
ncbi:MAG TPA: hypothetical protein VHF00_01220 [Acidimicrobiales bacterium]|nr:hypothetical protein [Acidimicrobiales bacterium]